MPAATLAEVTKWVEQAQEEGASYLMVVCDNFEWADYPMMVMPDQQFWLEFDRINRMSMQQVVKVYDLNHDIEAQLRERYPWHLPSILG